jgi:transposase
MNWNEFKSVNKGFSFVCIAVKVHSIIKVLNTRLSKDICDYFENRYELSEHQAVKTTVMELNASYQYFVLQLFPNTQIIVDRFHIVQLVNGAFNNVVNSILKDI